MSFFQKEQKESSLKEKMNIAIVDDDSEILNMMKLFFERKGHSVSTHQNPLNFLNGNSFNYDIILMDVMMPQINGIDLLEKLMKKAPHLKIMIMTAYSTLDKVINSHKNGAVHYITKPFSLGDLEKKIQEIV
jgi:DNA-binding NtrC family response regulator